MSTTAPIVRAALQAWKTGHHPILEGEYDDAIAELDRLEIWADVPAHATAVSMGPDDHLVLLIDPSALPDQGPQGATGVPHDDRHDEIAALASDLGDAIGPGRVTMIVGRVAAVVVRDAALPVCTACGHVGLDVEDRGWVHDGAVMITCAECGSPEDS